MLNDFDYDVMQKKRIASNARRRVCGSKSKFCGLPSDHMTYAQWKKHNGEVKTVNLNQPMSWQAFKGVPNDLQREYIQKCVDTFGCSLHDFGLMFRVNPMTISRNFQKIGIDMSSFKRGKRMDQDTRDKFMKWCEATTSAEQKDDPITEKPCGDKPRKVNMLSGCSHLEMTFSGEINYVDVMQILHQFADGKHIRLCVTADREASDEQI